MPDTVVTDYDYEQFITTIQHKARVSWDEAELAARSTLETLAEWLSAGEARDIARQLPGDLGKWLASSDGAQPFHADEFLRRVAEREGIDLETAESHARAVFIALGRVVSHQELEDMAAELPTDFLPLIAPAEAEADRLDPDEVVPAEEFVSRVADRSGLDEDHARRATEAVLEALAERIAGGEVDDLVAQLPADLRPALERDNERTGGRSSGCRWTSSRSACQSWRVCPPTTRVSTRRPCSERCAKQSRRRSSTTSSPSFRTSSDHCCSAPE
jgi:uncharacterized protein (DUF2267 family)